MEHTPDIGIEELLRHEAWVRRVARGLVRGEEAVDEVVQATWWDALRSPPKDGRNLRGWLGTVARNVVRRSARKEARRAEVELAAGAADDGAAPPPETALERIELQRRVAEAVLALDEPYRSVVVLRFYEELSPAEIGARLGSSDATVRTQLRRALGKLGDRLDGVYSGTSADWRAVALVWIGASTARRVGESTTAATQGAARMSRLAAAGWSTAAVVVVGVVAWVAADLDAPMTERATTTRSVATSDDTSTPDADGRAPGDGLRADLAPERRATPDAPALAATPTDATPAAPPVDDAPTAPAPVPELAVHAVFVADTRDEDLDGMVLVPGGETVVGTDPDDIARLGQDSQAEMTIIAAETPRHVVPVDTFLVDRTEVSNLQWRAYLEATDRAPSDTLVEYGWPGGVIPAGQEHLPVTNIDLHEVEDFLAWCGKRLPTEAEWTRAARGDDARRWPWGDAWDSRVAKYGGAPPAMPVAVDAFPEGAGPFGALQLVGNVFEWVDTPYVAHPGFRPVPFRAGKARDLLLTPEFDPERRVAKGGCFVSTRDQSRIDYRLSLAPDDSDAALGFRGARSPVAGRDAIVTALRRARPASFPTPEFLDLDDIVAAESWTVDDASGLPIVTGHRALAFAPAARSPRPGLERLRRAARDTPVVLGLLTTTEALASPPLPAGTWVLAYRAAGRSRARREAERVAAAVAAGASDADGSPATSAAERALDAIDDREPFPDDRDVILFCSPSGVVAGWAPCADVSERPWEPATLSAARGGRAWRLATSLDVVSREVPRFVVPLELAEGLPVDG